jgi:diacylglycerol O-acyltransferase / wax synthase
MKKALTLIDLAFLALESRVQTGHVGGLLIFTLPNDAPEGFFRQAVESHEDWRRVDGVYSLKLHRQGLRPHWVTDDTVDVEAHIQYLALPQPGTRRQLYTVVERLHAQPLDRQHPLWEVAFIEGLEGRRGAIYIKVHHALVDGISAIRTLLRTFSTTPHTPSPLLFWQPPPSPERPFSDEESLLPSPQSVLEKLWIQLNSATSAAPVATQELKRPLLHALGLHPSVLRSPFMAPRSILNRQITSRRRLASHEFSLRAVLAAAKAAEVTINDIVLMVCSSALRRYLAEHDALPQESLVTWMPISTRSEEDYRPSNQITMACVSLATDIADPLQRFRTIQASALAAKQEVTDRSRGVTEWVTLWRGGVPVLTNLLGVDQLLPPAANLTISNVPGIDKDFYFHGAKLEAVYPLSVLVGTMGLNITLLSCGDTLAVGLLACPDTVPELDTLAAYLRGAFTEFQQLFSSQHNATAAREKSNRRNRRM